jgi:hypothetical protein
VPAAGFSLFCFCLVAVQKLDLAALGGSCVLLLSVPDESTQDMGPMETRLEGWQIRRLLSFDVFSYAKTHEDIKGALLTFQKEAYGGGATPSWLARARCWIQLILVWFFVCCAKLDLAALGGACVLLFSFLCSRKACKTWANGNPSGRLENSVSSFLG